MNLKRIGLNVQFERARMHVRLLKGARTCFPGRKWILSGNRKP